MLRKMAIRAKDALAVFFLLLIVAGILAYNLAWKPG
jgi:hypothetical protein